MRSWLIYGLVAISAVLLSITITLSLIARKLVQSLISHPVDVRQMVDATPSDYGMPYEDVTITSDDGLRLAGWYMPGSNGAAIMLAHGFKSNRASMLEEAEMLSDSGYSVLVLGLRAHDSSEGDLITFGMQEMRDWQAWFQYLLNREEVDSARIGAMGTSLGASEAIQFASINEGIAAVVAHSPFSSIDDTMPTSIPALTGLPDFPFAPMMEFWAEQELGFDSMEIDAKLWIDDISPRPVLILQGGQDSIVSPESGDLLYAAAREPKELWFEADLGHASFDTELPEQFEQRIISFYDQYLLDN